MSILRELAAVRLAQRRVVVAHARWDRLTAALFARSHAHPLTTLGVAAGAGVVLGGLNVRALRVPGLGMLLSGGVADLAAFAMRLFSEFGIAGLGAMEGRQGRRGTGELHGNARSPADSPPP